MFPILQACGSDLGSKLGDPVPSQTIIVSCLFDGTVLQINLIITLSFGSIEADRVICEIVLQ